MAKIHTETIVVTISRLIKESEPQSSNLVTEEIVAALEQVTQELVGVGVIVEAERA